MLLGGSDFQRVHRRIERSVLTVDDMATIPRLPAASAPTVANAGLKSPAIFPVWLTTHAAVFAQSRSNQNSTLLASVPCDPQSLLQGPDGRAAYRWEPNWTRLVSRWLSTVRSEIASLPACGMTPVLPQQGLLYNHLSRLDPTSVLTVCSPPALNVPVGPFHVNVSTTH